MMYFNHWFCENEIHSYFWLIFWSKWAKTPLKLPAVYVKTRRESNFLILSFEVDTPHTKEHVVDS